MKEKTYLIFAIGFFLLIMSLMLLSCKKEEPVIKENFITVTYSVKFSKTTDFTFEYNDTTGAHKEYIYSANQFSMNATIKDQDNRDNVRVGSCVIKSSDINNCTMKVIAIVNGDTIKNCTLGTCCTVN